MRITKSIVAILLMWMPYTTLGWHRAKKDHQKSGFFTHMEEGLKNIVSLSTGNFGGLKGIGHVFEEKLCDKVPSWKGKKFYTAATMVCNTPKSSKGGKHCSGQSESKLFELVSNEIDKLCKDHLKKNHTSDHQD